MTVVPDDAERRGDRTDLEPPVVYTPPAVDLDGPLRQQIELLRAQNHNLEVEIEELKKAKAAHKPSQVSPPPRMKPPG